MSRFAKEVNEYLLKIKQGDKSWYGPLWEMTANHLLGIARMYIANKNLAEDVVSLSFIKVQNYIHSYDPNQDGYNWLCKIVQNMAYTVNEIEIKHAKAEKVFALQQEAVYEEKDFDRMDFFMLINGLEPTDKFVMYQRYYEDKKLDDISNQLKISKGAVSQKIKRLRKTLYKKYKTK